MGRMLAVVACIHLQRRAENAFCTAAVCLHVTNFACHCDGVLFLPYASSFFAGFRACQAQGQGKKQSRKKSFATSMSVSGSSFACNIKMNIMRNPTFLQTAFDFA